MASTALTRLSLNPAQAKALQLHTDYDGQVLRETATHYIVKAHPVTDNATRCFRCGAHLTTPESKLTGVGATCAQRLGIPYGTPAYAAKQMIRSMTKEVAIPKAAITSSVALVPQAAPQRPTYGSYSAIIVSNQPTASSPPPASAPRFQGKGLLHRIMRSL